MLYSVMSEKSYTKYHQEYYEKHREILKAKSREYQRAHPEKIREYKIKNAIKKKNSVGKNP